MRHLLTIATGLALLYGAATAAADPAPAPATMAGADAESAMAEPSEPVESSTPADTPGPPDPPASIDTSQPLDASEFLLAPLVLRAEPRLDEAGDAPFSGRAVTREQILERGHANVAEALAASPGVVVETGCQNCGLSAIRVNGLDGAWTPILFDTLDLWSSLSAVYGLEELPPELLRELRVVRGAGRPRWGATAIGGTVLVDTGLPDADGVYANLTLRLTALERPDTRVAVSGVHSFDPAGRTRMGLWTQARQRAAVDLTGDGFSDLPQLGTFAAGFRLEHDTSRGGHLWLAGQTTWAERRGGDQLSRPPHEVDIAEQVSTGRWLVSGGASGRIGERARGELLAAHVLTLRDSYYGGLAGARPPDDPGDAAGAQAWEEARADALAGYGQTRNPLWALQGTVDIDVAHDHTLELGGQLQSDRVRDEYLGRDRVTDERYIAWSGFAEHRWTGVSWVETSAGLRVDGHSALDRPYVSPRLSVTLWAAPEVSARTTGGAGVRAPRVFDEDIHLELVGGAVRGIVAGPDLRPERAWTVSEELMWRTVVGPDAWDLRLVAGAWYTTIRDVFTLETREPTGTGLVEVVRTNDGDAQVVGGDLTLELAAPRWSLRAGWTAQRARRSTPDPDFGDRELPRVPGHRGLVDAVVLLGPLRLEALLDVLGPMTAQRFGPDGEPDASRRTPWFADLGLFVRAPLVRSGGRHDVALTVGVYNVFDSRQRDLDRGPLRDANYVYGPRLPRTAFAGVSLAPGSPRSASTPAPFQVEQGGGERGGAAGDGPGAGALIL